MASRARLCLRFLLPLLALGVAACGAVDHYSGRAIRYNVQAERAQQQALLLNVVRSSLRRPMQFTTVTSLKGTGEAKASAAFTFPFFGPNFSTSNSATVTPVDYSETTEADVTVLDTSGFYRGFLSPVPGKLFDLYVQSGYPRDVLFNLFIKKIVMTRLDGPCSELTHVAGCEFTFLNYPGADLDIDLFQRMLNHLLRLGLTTESIPAPEKKADKKQKESKKDKKKKGDGGDDDDGGDDGDEDSAGTAGSDNYAFCFAPRYSWAVPAVRSSLCGSKEKSAVRIVRTAQPQGQQHPVPTRLVAEKPPIAHSLIRKKSNIGMIWVPPSLVEQLGEYAINDAKPELGEQLTRELGKFANRRVRLVFYTRSMENMIYYLGELVRRQLYPDQFGYGQTPRVIQVKTPSPYEPFPEDVCDNRNPAVMPYCYNLFVMHQGFSPSTVYSVDYEGMHYVVPEDLQTAGWSMQVLDIAKQLFVVNIKADELPNTGTISVFAR